MLDYVGSLFISSIIILAIILVFIRWKLDENKRVRYITKKGIGSKDDMRAVFESKADVIKYYKDNGSHPIVGQTICIKVDNTWKCYVYTKDLVWVPTSSEPPTEILSGSYVICTGDKYTGLKHQIFMVAKVDEDRLWLYNHGGNGYISVRKDQFSLYI